jgi:hypothetical protein
MQRPNQDKLNAFLGQMVGDLGAVASGALVLLGARLGLFKAMGCGDEMTSAELAQRTGTYEQHVKEWLGAQVAAGYVEQSGSCFRLNPEQAVVLADENSPAFMAGAFEVLSGLWIHHAKVAEAFRSGAELTWHDHSAYLFQGTTPLLSDGDKMARPPRGAVRSTSPRRRKGR